MKDTFRTVWIPLSSDLVARVRIDVLEEVLPARLEVEQSRLPHDVELTIIGNTLVMRTELDAPHIDVGLPPDPVSVSRHAQERAKERAGLDKDALARTAAKAFKEGLKISETTGNLRKFLDSKAAIHGRDIRVHGNQVYFFGHDDVLITVYALPQALHRSALSALQKRSR